MELLPAAARLQSPSPSVLHPLTAVGAVSPGKVAPSVSLRRAPLRLLQLSLASPQPSLSLIASAAAGLSAASTSSRWVVDMEKPPDGVASSRAGVIDYYVDTLSKILGDEREAQVCIYDASWQTEFRFCCNIDQEASKELADLPCVLSVKPDTNLESIKSSRNPNNLPRFLSRSEDVSPIFAVSQVNSGYWMVKMRKPGVEVVTKAQIVDYYADTLTKVLGNEKDAQACIYHISWEKDFGFCCQIDEECARQLADVPEVVRVHPDINFDSKNKDYGGVDTSQKSDVRELPESGQISDIKTKRLFVTGLSFYTSEKTLRAAFEGFGELVEVKIIMDRISKRSKGYAFIEYTTEDAASAALKEMNGKIINGWMIVVDVAKTNPPRYSREGWRPSNSASSSY